MLALLAQSTTKANPLVSFLPILLLVGLFYLFLIRPQQRRAKAQQSLINSVEVGDDVITTGGIYGTVTDIDDEDGTVTLQIAPDVGIRILRAGIGRLATVDDGTYDEDEDDSEEEDPAEVEDQPSVSDGSQEYPDQPGQIKEL